MDVRGQRAGMFSGAAFALLLFVGMIMMFAGQPDTTDKDSAQTVAQKWLAAAHDGSHRNKMLVGGFLLMLAALALLWFASTLRNRYVGDGSPFMAFAMLAAVGVAGAIAGPLAIVGGHTFGGDPLSNDGNVLWALGDLAMPMLLVVFGLAMAAMLATFAVVARAALPRWLVVFTWVAAVAALAAVEFLPLLVTLVYFLVLGVWGGVRVADARPSMSPSAAPATA